MKTLTSVSLCVLFLLSSLPSYVQSVCYCPWNCERAKGGDCKWRVAMCIDQEAASECQKANWEIEDMLESMSSLVGIVLDDGLRSNNVTALQVGYIRSLLSLAIEDEKPEGDCSNGLATTTRMRNHPNSCFSPELLQQCAKVRDAVDSYQTQIPVKLESFLRDSERLYDSEQSFFGRSFELEIVDSDGIVVNPFVQEILEIVRFRTLVKTARIRCASFDATAVELEHAAAFSASSIALGLSISSTIVSLILVHLV